MIRRNSAWLGKFFPLTVVAAVFLVASVASGASIRFDDVSATQGGILGFDGPQGGAGILYGYNIDFFDVDGLGGTNDDVSVFACVSCTLSFSVRAIHNADNSFTIQGGVPNEISMEGEVATVTTAPPPLPREILSGQFNSLPGGGTSTGLFQFGGIGLDFKDEQLVEYFFGPGIVGGPDGKEFAFSLQLQTTGSRQSGPAPADDAGVVPTDDIDFFWAIEDAQMLNTPAPAPATTALLVLGLSMIAVHRKRG